MDPDFLDKTACLPPDMYNDWLSVLAAENSRRINDANEWNHAFHTSRSAEYIFTACTRLRLPQEVKYSALLIFDNFMVQLVSRLHESVYNSKRSDRKKYQEWNRIEATLSRQTTLRMLSAIQIASKMHSYHESLSIKTVKLCLKTLGFAYTEESVVRSELRVLSMIDWEPSYHCTPLIYKRMMVNVMGPSANIVTREQMCRVQADWFLLACGVIVTAVCCVDGMQAADEVTNELHRLSNIPLADITDMSVAIIECVISQQGSTCHQ
ncbi:unnamed protein product [Onchocerca flexuosa]|uniref:Cyclin N-terminal domain-containing protein n=1 Tax=Onchocerca flexuosa TaxID=387005 RepID=A0A183I5S8_9BILA|nr:unnamed protein product [Onchocerca flexuosa]